MTQLLEKYGGLVFDDIDYNNKWMKDVACEWLREEKKYFEM